jgi:hypothetical protein
MDLVLVEFSMSFSIFTMLKLLMSDGSDNASDDFANDPENRESLSYFTNLNIRVKLSNALVFSP